MSILATAADTFVGGQLSPNTRIAYRKDLNRFLTFLGGALTISQELVIEYRDELIDTLAPATAARAFGTARLFMRFINKGMPTEFDTVKAPRRIKDQSPVVPSDNDVAALVQASMAHPERRLIIALLLNGLRAAEVCNLRWADLITTPEGLLMRVLGKGNKERMVPATSEVALALPLFNKQGTYVVADYDGSQRNTRQIEHAVYKTAQYAGITGMHPHALRHHYATRLIRAGVSVLHLQRLLGHARADTTAMYVTLNTDDLFEAAKLDPRNEPVKTGLMLVA